MRAACFLLSVVSLSSFAAAPKSEELPAGLREWVPWVQHAQKEAGCPWLHGSEARACAWPGRLTLTLDEHTGRFTQSFAVYAEAWLRLPGDAKRWPQHVALDGKPTVVVADELGRPTALLPVGEHQLTGDFAWDALPEAIEVPQDTGLLSLTVKGAAISLPNRDATGRVFLARERSQQETDRAELDVHRLVTDEIPLTLTTSITLKVSGSSRELVLGRALPDGFVPLSLSSPLPVRVEPDGHLRLQVRPGTWVVQLVARSEGPIASVKRPAPNGPWVDGDEVWVFDARPSLRQVLLEGVNAVDASQTTLPAEWRSLPAYAVTLTDEVRLTERRRGDADPAPDVLNLQRVLWLDFSGGGFTVSDRITGQLHRSWRLDVQPGTELGRVVASGADQSITRLTGGLSGVELRQGALALEAESRMPAELSHVSAVSWDADFNSVGATLQLPPGWTLLAASGADQVPNTWLDRWTLFDLFLVLIISVAMGRLFGLGWGALALVTLGLGWQESGIPQYSWLVVLVAEGLHRVLPTGWVKTLLGVTRFAAWAALVVISLAFSVEHVRHGMYPALATNRALGGVKTFSEYSTENAAQYARSNSFGSTSGNEWQEEDGKANGQVAAKLIAPPPPPAAPPPLQQATAKKRSFNVRDFDKNATVQTGPGLPRWEWQAVPIHFSGPVQRDQRLSLTLIGPVTNLVLAFVRVALLGLLLLCVLGFPGGFWPKRLKAMVKTGAPAATALLVLLLSSGALANEFPDPELLEQLRARLNEKPTCLPSCASSPRLSLEVSPARLRMRVEVLAGAHTAIPLPGSAQQWVPEVVLLDGHSTSALRRQGETLWLAMPAGVHQVELEGALPQRDTVQVALGLRSYRVEAKLEGWTLDGLHEDGLADESLQLTRKTTNEKGVKAAMAGGTLPPFVRVERTLELGLQWTVETHVIRASPQGSAVVLEVPLLTGESVTSSDVRVVNGRALVNLPATANEVIWTSVLEAKSPIELTAPSSVPWVEEWRLDVSPVWHVTLAGIPVVHQQDASGVRLPDWRPWPGEKVQVDIVRPEAQTGQTLTIDQSSLSVAPGARATEVTWTANLRSSRGGLHVITLPEAAVLQSVTLNGAQQPIRQEGRTVAIPLVPGSVSVVIIWRDPNGITTSWTTPALDVGTPTVNADIEVKVPADRWVLLVRGPGLGPAVLFWSFVLVLLVISIGLSRTRLTPLEARHWVLLALGLSQVPVPAIVFVFGWLLFLGWRKKTDLSLTWFNLTQLAIVAVTVVALVILGVSVYEGLLGRPEMQVSGNGSSESLLRWFQDRTTTAYPTAWVLSVPMLVYRGAMLLWSLWMALSLISWLKWGWQAFSVFGLWKRSPPKVFVPPAAVPPGSTPGPNP
jgi:hypothetical protein